MTMSRAAVHRTCNDDSGDRVLEDQLLLVIGLEDHRILVEALDASGQFDAAHEVDREEDSLLAGAVEKCFLYVLGCFLHCFPFGPAG